MSADVISLHGRASGERGRTLDAVFLRPGDLVIVRIRQVAHPHPPRLAGHWLGRVISLATDAPHRHGWSAIRAILDDPFIASDADDYLCGYHQQEPPVPYDVFHPTIAANLFPRLGRAVTTLKHKLLL